MKRAINIFIIFVLLISLSFSSCGTTDSYEMPTGLAILIGNHSNSKKHNISIDEEVTQVYSSFGNICIIGVDGNPSVLKNNEGKIIGYIDSAESERRKGIKNNNKKYWETHFLSSQVKDVIQNLSTPSDDSEVDTLKSISMAVKALNEMERSMGEDIKKEIIIYDTGLCTSGALSFVDSDWTKYITNSIKIGENENTASEIGDLVDNLKNRLELPDLTDISITWYGLGNVADPQPELTNLQIINLQYIWGELLIKSGATPSNIKGSDSQYGIFVVINSDGNNIEYDKYVTTISFEDTIYEEQPITSESIHEVSETEHEIIFSPETTAQIKTINSEPETTILSEIKLPEEILGFERNKSEYLSNEAADKVLQPYAQKLIEHPKIRILLVGTTADPNRNGGSISLSEERGEKVKASLIELGVSETRIDVVGIGATGYWYENEWKNGYFYESIAIKNRAVIILSRDSLKAKKIMGEE